MPTHGMDEPNKDDIFVVMSNIKISVFSYFPRSFQLRTC